MKRYSWLTCLRPLCIGQLGLQMLRQSSVVHRFNSSNFILQLGRQWAGSGRRHQSISRPVRSDVV